MDEFELYLAKRRRTGRIILIGVAAFVVASIAIPFVLMEAGVIRKDTFEIFVVADVLLGVAGVRAGFMRLKDAGKWDGSIPFS